VPNQVANARRTVREDRTTSQCHSDSNEYGAFSAAVLQAAKSAQKEGRKITLYTSPIMKLMCGPNVSSNFLWHMKFSKLMLSMSPASEGGWTISNKKITTHTEKKNSPNKAEKQTQRFFHPNYGDDSIEQKTLKKKN
jgi:hypothetical protein